MQISAAPSDRSPRPARRGAFTLVEMLVVIGILLAITTLVIVTFNASAGGDKMRSAARIAQSAVLGARDRALHAKDRRGLRFLRDPQDSSLIIGFTYLQPLPVQTYGQPASATVTVCRPDMNNDHMGNDATADTPNIIVVSGADGQALFNLDSQGMLPLLNTRLRIPASSGTWHTPVVASATPPYYVTMQGANAVLQVTTNVVQTSLPMNNAQSLPAGDANASMDVDLGNELLPYQQLISLPSGVVIDLKWCSGNVSSGWNTTPPSHIDLMYSPRGMLTGPIAAQGPIHMLLRDIQDAVDTTIDPRSTTQLHRERLVLTIFPQTGNCGTFPPDPTDLVDNTTGNAGADGLADDLFHFAKLGSTAAQ